MVVGSSFCSIKSLTDTLNWLAILYKVSPDWTMYSFSLVDGCSSYTGSFKIWLTCRKSVVKLLSLFNSKTVVLNWLAIL